MIKHLVIRLSVDDFLRIKDFLKGEENPELFFNGILRENILYLYSRNSYFDALKEYVLKDKLIENLSCSLLRGTGIDHEISLLENNDKMNWVIDDRKFTTDEIFLIHNHSGIAGEENILERLVDSTSIFVPVENNHFTASCRGDAEKSLEITVPLPGGFLKAGRSASESVTGTSSQNHRTALLLGEEGMGKIQEISLGCVGAGGLMNHFITGAMHLGIKHYFLSDGDRLEESNLNRFLGGEKRDIQSLKVDVMLRKMISFNNQIEVLVEGSNFPSEKTVSLLDASDILVCGIDNNRDRFLLQIYALATHRPLLDMGCGIYLDDGGVIDEWGGQVRLSLPGGPCLCCMGLAPDETCVNSTAGDYGSGGGNTPASIVTLNAGVANKGLSVILRYLLLDPYGVYHIKYDELDMKIYHIMEDRKKNCTLCFEY